MKKLLIGALSAVLVLSVGVIPVSASDAWTLPYEEGSTQVEFVDQSFTFPSFFRPNNEECSSEMECSVASAPYGHGFIDYPVCESGELKFCIDGLNITSNGATEKAEYVSSTLGSTINIAIPQGEFVGGTPSIWLAGQQLYAIHAFSGFSWDKSGTRIEKLEIALAPVRIGVGTCLISDPSNCYIEENFSKTEVASLKIKVPEVLGGFYMGRILNAGIKQSPSDGHGSRTITISGKAEIVHRAGLSVPKGIDLPSGLREGEGAQFPSFDGAWFALPFIGKIFDFARTQMKDAAAATTTHWRIYAMNPASTPYGVCTGKVPDLLGFGTTNAMLYDYNPPEFNDGFLDFKTAGMHFEPDAKTLALGTYEVQLNSTFARCMYGLSKLPLYASISVINDSNQKVVGSSVVGEKGKWLKLKADGFTFSKKTVRVKIGQSKAKVAQKIGSKAKK